MAVNYFGLFVDRGSNIAESNETNNTLFATNAMLIKAPDLVLAQLSAPASAQFVQTFAIHFAVTNAGGSDAIGGWNDQLYFGPYANSLAGATLLATLAGTSLLTSGSAYTVLRESWGLVLAEKLEFCIMEAIEFKFEERLVTKAVGLPQEGFDLVVD